MLKPILSVIRWIACPGRFVLVYLIEKLAFTTARTLGLPVADRILGFLFYGYLKNGSADAGERGRGLDLKLRIALKRFHLH